MTEGGPSITVDSPSTTRIFISGLNKDVGISDLHNIFSSLGSVSGVEFVRTNGRNFAFMDFKQNSDKALAKLFSLYNGCTWKGGKLKLEKAKEHYLARLKREWAEDKAPSLPANNDTNREKGDLQTSDFNNIKLHIYFPKLRKVRAVPLKGTGKHKYSFRRLTVPSTLPLLSCDCEEHVGPLKDTEENKHGYISDAAHEMEFSMMNSVFHKILERERASCEMENPDVDFPNHQVNGNIQIKEPEHLDEDSDDLVINIGVKRNYTNLPTDQLDRQEIGTENKMKRTKLIRPSAKEAIRSPKNYNTTTSATENNSANKALQRVTFDIAEASGDEQVSPTALAADQKAEGGIWPIIPGNRRKMSSHSEASANAETAEEPKKSNTWMQKSSWRDLVGEASNMPFSLSFMLPCNTMAHPKHTNNSEDSERHSVGLAGKGYIGEVVTAKKRKTMFGGGTPKSSSGLSQLDKKIAASVGHPLNSDTSKRAGKGKSAGHVGDDEKLNMENGAAEIKAGEVCPFMRSAESEKEWFNAKKKLTGYMKKINKQVNT